MKKPELLLPVGNIEAFHAAVAGGADAVYLGLPNFNARKKAANFTYNQLLSLMDEASKNKIKVYITLNTIIKNSELPDLIDNLYVLTQLNINAVIIQDWGVYYLIKKYFPSLTVHASTQMAMHNSLGAQFAENNGFERIILARELMMEEIASISKNSSIELEFFVHGALCYSFSGICLFSSYLGGMSANRGQCRQPCRRLYHTGNKSQYLFSLKDFQLIDLLPKLKENGVASMKIEGRMKSAEYVYNTAKAYRLALDHPKNIQEAKILLRKDMGRDKTQYFMGKDVSNSITTNPFLGIYAGIIKARGTSFFEFKTTVAIHNSNRLRIQNQLGRDSKTIKIEKMIIDGKEKISAKPGDYLKIIQANVKSEIGDKVIISRLNEKKFSSKLIPVSKKLRIKFPLNQKNQILNKIHSKKQSFPREIYLRIDNLNWLRKLNFKQFDKLIFNLSRKDMTDYNWNNRFLKSQIRKIIIQFPEFIPEKQIDFYSQQINTLISLGYNAFMISHISQLNFFIRHKSVSIYASESIYSLNDASVAFYKSQRIKSWIYPLENDLANLISQENHEGIIPLYFLPKLFYSRMPVKLRTDIPISDKSRDYHVLKKDGMTIVVPDIPVSLVHYHEKLKSRGYKRFLLDLSFLPISKSKVTRLINKFNFSEVEQPGTIFNFKEGLS